MLKSNNNNLEMTYPINVMIDPSLVLNLKDYKERQNIKKIYEFSKANKEFKFYLPKSLFWFFEEFNRRRRYDYNKELLKFLDLYLNIKIKYTEPWFPLNIGGFWEYLKINFDYLKEYRFYEIYEIRNKNIYENYKFFIFKRNLMENLGIEYEESPLLNIIFEEWVFLQSESNVTSKFKKIFDEFKKAGAVYVEIKTVLNRYNFDYLVRKTLKKNDNEPLDLSSKLRAIGKWIAVFSPPIVSIFNPLIGGVLSASTGFFLLIDPK